MITHVYFHAWHWLFQQIQLDNWFGNVVAGVVAWLVARDRYKTLHQKLNQPLHEKVDHIIFHHPDIPDFPKGDK